MEDWYKIQNVELVDTPALVIYADRVKKNLSTLKSFVDNMADVRPHVKTNKCPQVVRLMLEAGITKFKCATIAEAEMLAMEKAKDVLLAYPPTGPKARRFIQLVDKFKQTTFSCVIDNMAALRDLSQVADAISLEARVFIDLNVGMDRTGIRPGPAAIELFREASNLRGITFVGLHAYDGHLRDRDPGMLRKKCDEAYQPVDDIRREILQISGKDPVVVAGGTPTFPIHAKRKNVEASPGTFIFWDAGYQQLLPDQPFEPAALVVTRAISAPADNYLCLDLGHKSIASENPLSQRVYLLNGPGLEPVGHSEEHMVFANKGGHNYPPGFVFYGVPHHICPTVALYDEAAVCLHGLVKETWPILARRRKISV